MPDEVVLPNVVGKEAPRGWKCKLSSSVQTCCCSVAQSCLILRDPMDHSMPGFPPSLSPGDCSDSYPLSRWCSIWLWPTESVKWSSMWHCARVKAAVCGGGWEGHHLACSSPSGLWFPIGMFWTCTFEDGKRWSMWSLREQNSKSYTGRGLCVTYIVVYHAFPL